MADARSRLVNDSVAAAIGAAIAVLVVVVVASADRSTVVPAIAIGAVVATGNLLVDNARRRNDDLTNLLLQRPSAPDVVAPDARSAGRAHDERNQRGAQEHTEEPAVPVPLLQFLADDRRRDEPQCPNCGRFLVDPAPNGTSSYRCRACRAAWEWKRGAPWPDVTVVPDLRRLPGP